MNNFIDKYECIVYFFAMLAIALAFIVGLLMMPVAFRSGVMPEIRQIRQDQANILILEKRIDLLSELAEYGG